MASHVDSRAQPPIFAGMLAPVHAPLGPLLMFSLPAFMPLPDSAAVALRGPAPSSAALAAAHVTIHPFQRPVAAAATTGTAPCNDD
jgi:hypothetical protein